MSQLGGDMALTATFSTKDVMEGLARVERGMSRLETSANASADRVNSSFSRIGNSFIGMNRLGQAGIAGVTGAAAMGRKSLIDYAKQNDTVNSKVDELGVVWGRVWTNMGRDAANSGVLEYIISLGREVEKFQTGLHTKTSGQLGKDAAGSYGMMLVNSMVLPLAAYHGFKTTAEGASAIAGLAGGDDARGSRLAEEEQQRVTRNNNLLRQADLRSRQEMARLRGDELGAAEIGLDLAREQAKLEANALFADPAARLERELYITLKVIEAEERLNQVREKIADTRQGDRNKKYEAFREDVEKKLGAEREREKRADQDARDRAKDGSALLFGAEMDMEFLEDEARIVRMRAQGREKEADAAAMVLRYEQQIQAIRMRDDLPKEDREDLMQRLRTLKDFELGSLRMVGGRIVGAQSLGGGLAGAPGLAGQVFGAGPKTNDATREMLNVQKQSRDILQRIERKVGAAVYN